MSNVLLIFVEFDPACFSGRNTLFMRIRARMDSHWFPKLQVPNTEKLTLMYSPSALLMLTFKTNNMQVKTI